MEIKRLLGGKYIAYKVPEGYTNIKISEAGNLFGEKIGEQWQISADVDFRGCESKGLISDFVENENSEYYSPSELAGWINYNFEVEEWNQWLIIKLNQKEE